MSVTTVRKCDGVDCGRTEVKDWITLRYKRMRWDFCSPACFHSAGRMLSDVLPAPYIA